MKGRDGTLLGATVASPTLTAYTKLIDKQTRKRDVGLNRSTCLYVHFWKLKLNLSAAIPYPICTFFVANLSWPEWPALMRAALLFFSAEIFMSLIVGCCPWARWRCVEYTLVCAPLHLSHLKNPEFWNTSRSKGFSKATFTCPVEARGSAAVRYFSVSLPQLPSRTEPFPAAVKLIWFLEPLSPALKLTPEKDSRLSWLGHISTPGPVTLPMGVAVCR